MSEPHGNGRNYANDAVETSDGYLVIGEEETSDSPQNSWPIGNLVAVKLSFSGEIIWKKTYDHPTEEHGYDITKTSDGNFAITGTLNDHPLFALIDKDGNELQYQQLSYEGYGHSIYESRENAYLISGTSHLTNGTSNVIFTYSSDNSSALLTDFGLGFPLRMTPEGSLAFGMFHELSTNQSLGLLIGLDQDGSAIWQRHTPARINAAMTLPDGYMATGFTSSGANIDLWIGKVDESGNTIWETNLAVDSLCSVNSIVPTQDGNFLVGVRFREGMSCTHSWLMKFDANGNQIK